MGWIKTAAAYKANTSSRRDRSFFGARANALKKAMQKSVGRFLTDEHKKLLTPRQLVLLNRGTAVIRHCRQCGIYTMTNKPREWVEKGGRCYSCFHGVPLNERKPGLNELLEKIYKDTQQQQEEQENIKVETNEYYQN